ncbi:hypothetical protein AK830_g2616 [Neonectria ditissima]|uniref:Uncharacterized protein n=1 Tax=Neonectria ditissima TaxID=78410 RepID=A0A0P7BUL0_9HYPO|nr:hypothetical protein AK830_g2616 [Neonectria ditissima]
MSIPRPTLPIFTSVLGVLGIAGGVYNFVSPAEGAKGFGLTPASKTPPTAHSKAFEHAFILVHGIRNVGVGLTTVGLVLFWQFSPLCRASPQAALAVRQCLGISLAAGTVVGLGDAWIIKRFSDAEGVETEAREVAVIQSAGHAVTAVAIAGLGLTYLLV